MSEITGGPRSPDDRKRLVADAVRTQVVQGGRVESQQEFEAVMVFGQPVNHTPHLIATLATCGLWGLVWLIITLTGGEKRKMVNVDEFGNVLVQDLGKR